MKVAVIGGTGGQGLGIAARFVQAGQDVIIGSRTVDKAEAAVAKVKELLPVAENVRAMANPDIFNCCRNWRSTWAVWPP